MATTLTLIAVAAIIAYVLRAVRAQRLARAQAAQALAAKRSAAARKAAVTRARNKALKRAAPSDEPWLADGIANALGAAIDATVERPVTIPGGVHWPFYADAMDRVGTISNY